MIPLDILKGGTVWPALLDCVEDSKIKYGMNASEYQCFNLKAKIEPHKKREQIPSWLRRSCRIENVLPLNKLARRMQPSHQNEGLAANPGHRCPHA